MELNLEILAWAFVGGLVGTAAMDSIKYVGHKLRLIGGVKMNMLGRWALGMLKGKFIHADIHHYPSFNNEVGIGWLFHYVVGGLVAIAFPFLLAPGSAIDQAAIIKYSIMFGLATSVLPWFVVYPAFGVGFFGVRAPKEAKPVLTSIVSHTCYGFGIGAVLAVTLI